MVPVDVNNPATWRFLAGAGNMASFTADISAQHVIGLGANGTYTGVFADYWGNSVQTDYWKLFFSEIRRLGGVVYVQITPWDFGGHPGDFPSNCRDIINNVDGMQDIYINWCKNVCTDVMPDVLQIMNEVMGDDIYSTGTPQFWTNYIAFCNKYMATMAQIKPNLIFSVSGVPFWNLTEIALHTSEFVIPAGCKLLYSYHEYYSFSGTTPSPSGDYQYSYWNGDFVTGKQGMYDKWINGQGWNAGGGGMKALWDKGQKVIFDEQGTCITNPNFGAWMKDAIEFCVANGVGFVYLDNTGVWCHDFNNKTLILGYCSRNPWQTGVCDKLPYTDQASCELNGGTWVPIGEIDPYSPNIPIGAEQCACAGGIWWFNHSPASFWDNMSWNLNAIGQKWVELVVSAPPPVQLPFHDSFTNPTLPNWNKVNGNWDIK